MSLETLPQEILLFIFNHLNLLDICHLRATCKTIRAFVDSWDHVLFRPNNEPLVTNQASKKFLERCLRKKLTNREKLKIEQNWITGKYKETPIFRTKVRYMPHLLLNHEYLWLSRGKQITCYRRTPTLLETQPLQMWGSSQNEEVTHFTIKNRFLVCGFSEGSVGIQSMSEEGIMASNQMNIDYTGSVDITDDCCLIAAGMRSNAVFFYMVQQTPTLSLQILPFLNLGVRVWSVRFCKDRNMIAIGTSAKCFENNSSFSSIFIYDTERLEESVQFRTNTFTSGTLDVKWDGPNNLWTCGSNDVHKWDLRSGQIVQKYEDPYGPSFYTMELDYCNTVALGSNVNGQVTMFDTRMSGSNPFGVYFMKTCRGERRNSSPVYSLSFDSELLFVATDRYLNILNFNSNETKSRNYKRFYRM